MTVKAFAYFIQAQLKSSAGLDVRRSHVYELLAASYGFNSFAALHRDHIFTEWPGDQARPALHEWLLRERCTRLRLDTGRITTVLPPMLAAAHIAPMGLSTLFDLIRDGDLETVSPGLLEAVRHAADAGHGEAHWILAGLYDPHEIQASAYWYARQQAGKMLSGVEAEWADNERKRREYALLQEQHLAAAARLGHLEARRVLAERSDDPREWYTLAASAGDTSAMRALVEDDQDDPQQRWTWIYLARLLGNDVLASTLRAYHEDGSDYDDDVGGPLHVAGGEALEVEPLDAASDRAAREAAQALFESIPRADLDDEGARTDEDW
ncbi:hypothetical protein G4G28_09165 [Massilia sp. Dwa41.01b]|uniref:hypothetical protein n=1 Tax=unclassified Massilia TaxID=2609279 RepID=UPI0016045C85|nr:MULTISPECIES: hypothetical protein [unclassified Massilia]QNA88618.1 hypothetical protein G4G28_09165 [Massilia sp. Dwa41.01b]QNA99508.1 hypothetical protein G4G31_12820 [Massilia sp. Se16.2.3]